MDTPSSTISKPSDSKTSREIAASGANLADLLASAGNGIRITGLVLVVDDPKEIRGTSGKGNSYAFAVREMQIFTGNKAVLCKHQLDIPKEGQAQFPNVSVGSVQTFRIKNFRMNGTVPVLELDTSI